MKLESLNPSETHKLSKEKFSLIKDNFLKLFKEYEHKDRISILFEFWLWNIRILYIIYGKKGLSEFLKSDLASPNRFAILKATNNSINPIIKPKSNTYFFWLLSFFSKNLFFQGANLRTNRKKILGRISRWFLKSIPIKTDHELKKEIYKLLIDYLSDIDIDGLEELLLKKLPLTFFSKPINSRSRFKNITLECAASCFLEFANYEMIFLLNKKIYLKGFQHGGGYDTFCHDYWVEYEKSLCDEFIGWGLSAVNDKQAKFTKLNYKKSEKKSKKRIIWIEDSLPLIFFYMIEPNNYYQPKRLKSTEYIYSEIKDLGFEYFNLTHPVLPSDKYATFRGKSLKRNNNKGENLFLPEDIGIFDNSGATLIHFFVENEMPFVQIIDRSDIDRATTKQKEWFKVLYDAELCFYNDEPQRLASGLKKIMDKGYCLPIEVINYHKKIFRV
ncbi:hypothetical protein OAD94_02740 [Amylibacter sp.]|nr:hypothetical protein [Amylibacter sp.]